MGRFTDQIIFYVTMIASAAAAATATNRFGHEVFISFLPLFHLCILLNVTYFFFLIRNQTSSESAGLESICMLTSSLRMYLFIIIITISYFDYYVILNNTVTSLRYMI